MDLSQFEVSETGTLELLDAAEDPMVVDGKPVTVTVYGPGSKVYAKAQAAQSNRLLDKLKKKGKTEETADEKAREQAEFLSAITKEFSANFAGTEQTPDLFKTIYANRKVGFIADQVAKFASEWANFRPHSKTS